MRDRLQAVSRMFWAAVLAALVVVPVGMPIGDDRTTLAVLEELQAFKAGFPREKLEQDLLAHAARQGMVAAADVLPATGAGSKGVPELSVGKLPAIAPRAALALDTLGAVEDLSKPGAMLDIASPDPESIGTALGWRLARMGGEGYTLTGLELTRDNVPDALVKREAEASEARLALVEANATLKRATAKHEAANELWEARKKWKAPRKSIARANEKRVEARDEMVAADADRTAKRERYDALAKAAMGFRAKGASEGEQGVVVARLQQKPDGKEITLQLPVALTRRSVPVPHLQGASFPVAKEHGLWSAIAGGTVDQAIAQLEERFTWHYAHVSLGGFKLGGMTALQLAPLLSLLFLAQISRRARGVGETYNPFDRPSAEALPRVGMGNRVLNLLALVGLPLLGAVLCAWSLIQIGQIPVVPVLCTLGVVGIGGVAQSSLGELMELRDAIERSHSHPPPAPTHS